MDIELKSTTLRQSRSRYFSQHHGKRSGKASSKNKLRKHELLSVLTQNDLSTGIDLDSCRNMDFELNPINANVENEGVNSDQKGLHEGLSQAVLALENKQQEEIQQNNLPRCHKRTYFLTLVSRLPTLKQHNAGNGL